MSRARKTKRTVDPGAMRVRTYTVLTDAVERGVEYGWVRAHKHTDTPQALTLKRAIYDAVMAEICERFEFPREDA